MLGVAQFARGPQNFPTASSRPSTKAANTTMPPVYREATEKLISLHEFA
jgi:hypothetical protein